ncbi:MAG: hypothetical protein EHM49_06065, partial [Deltaproteobacteria bacterium]
MKGLSMAAKLKYRITGKPTLGKGRLAVALFFEPKSLRMTETPFGVIFDLDESYTVGEPGTPGFPMHLIRLALPAFSDVTNIKATAVKTLNVTEKPVFVAPIQEPQPGFPPQDKSKSLIKKSLYDGKRKGIDKPSYVQKIQGVTSPDLKKYQRALAIPAQLVRVSNIEHRGVATVLTLEINPVKQNKSGLIELTTEVKIEIEYESTSVPKATEPVIGSRHFKPARTKLESTKI